MNKKNLTLDEQEGIEKVQENYFLDDLQLKVW
jgi:hypothetical protein